MGAEQFMTRGHGKTAAAAFAAARKQALIIYGRGGYSGTLAEKKDFVEIPMLDTDIVRFESKSMDRVAEEFAQELIAKHDPRIDDKWGPAGCIQIGPRDWLFFGWASS